MAVMWYPLTMRKKSFKLFLTKPLVSSYVGKATQRNSRRLYPPSRRTAQAGEGSGGAHYPSNTGHCGERAAIKIRQ